jgi:hypothetical protein
MGAKKGFQIAPAFLRDAESPAVQVLEEPILFQGVLQEGGSEGSAQVRAAFAPIQAGVGETPAEGSGGFDIDTESGERFRASWRQIVGAGEPLQGLETIVQLDAEGAGEVVVTGAGGTEADRGRGDEFGARKNAEAFERAGDARAFQAVITMFALDEYFDQALSGEAGQVGAGGGGADASDDGELGTGTGAGVHERVKDAGAGRLADGGCQAGDGKIDIHGSIVNEVWMFPQDAYCLV